MKHYVVFDLAGTVAFFDRAISKVDAIETLAAEDDTYTDLDLNRVHELEPAEVPLMEAWIAGGQKSNAWPFEWPIDWATT